MNTSKKRRFFFPVLIAVIVTGILLLAACASLSALEAVQPEEPGRRTEAEERYLSSVLDTLYPERTSPELSALPYPAAPAQLAVNAGSAILVDVQTGSILYEKNADESIPPASMTKLVEMYVVFKAVEDGEVSLDDEVPLPPESWAENLPSDASRMYLGEGQHVTLRELLLGLAIASGNDASIAVARYVCGSMEDFVARMNSTVSSMGLTRTHFVESSGYSEENRTTAREFAAFSRMYLKKYPQSLSLFHAQAQLRYPQAKNLPAQQRHLGDSLAITQRNTNKLLGKIPGCDGLKTGYIDESGYNIALTAEQNGTRFLSITMRGPGHSTAEGNLYRIADGLTLFNYAFSHFADYHAPQQVEHEFTVGLTGAQGKAIKLVPALDETFTVPFIAGDSPTGAAASVHVRADVPDCLYGGIRCGQQYGTLTYYLEDSILRTVPLVADRDVPAAGLPGRLWGKLLYRLALFFVQLVKQ